MSSTWFEILSAAPHGFCGLVHISEHIFPYLGVRFVAINDHFDTADQGIHDGYIVPLTNILNESYSRDISRKISSAIKTKELHGDFRGPFAPYGYSKCPADHGRLEINPETAPVVMEIFALRMQGMGYTGIARLLNKRGYRPLAHISIRRDFQIGKPTGTRCGRPGT